MKKVYIDNNSMLHDIKNNQISENITREILNSQYTMYELNDNISNKNFAEILQILNDGYSVDDLNKLGISESQVKDFLSFLKEQNLTVENAKALNMYSCDSSTILEIKNWIKSPEDIMHEIDSITANHLSQRGLNDNQVSDILIFVKNLDYNKPLYQNFAEAKQYLLDNDISKSCLSTICTAVKQHDTIHRIDSIIFEIDDALDKSSINESTVLYRAIKLPNATTGSVANDLMLENHSYTSTSPIYESSFAKYDNYNVVFEMYVPACTHGISLAPFSDYDSTESEILLGPNSINILNIQNIVDNFDNEKIIVSSLVLDNNLEVYNSFSNDGFAKD